MKMDRKDIQFSAGFALLFAILGATALHSVSFVLLAKNPKIECVNIYSYLDVLSLQPFLSPCSSASSSTASTSTPSSSSNTKQVLSIGEGNDSGGSSGVPSDVVTSNVNSETLNITNTSRDDINIHRYSWETNGSSVVTKASEVTLHIGSTVTTTSATTTAKTVSTAETTTTTSAGPIDVDSDIPVGDYDYPSDLDDDYGSDSAYEEFSDAGSDYDYMYEDSRYRYKRDISSGSRSVQFQATGRKASRCRLGASTIAAGGFVQAFLHVSIATLFYLFVVEATAEDTVKVRWMAYMIAIFMCLTCFYTILDFMRIVAKGDPSAGFDWLQFFFVVNGIQIVLYTILSVFNACILFELGRLEIRMLESEKNNKAIQRNDLNATTEPSNNNNSVRNVVLVSHV